MIISKTQKFRRLTCLVTAMVMLFSVFASAVFASEITSKKQLVVEVLDGDESGRLVTIRAGLHDALVELDEGATVDYVMDMADDSQTFNRMSDAMKTQLRNAFEEYRAGTNLNATRKALIKEALDKIMIYDDFDEVGIYDAFASSEELSKFPAIKGDINDYLLGDSNEARNRGVKLMLALMKFVTQKSSQPIAHVNASGNLDLSISGYPNLTAAMDYFISSFYRAGSSLENLFTELETKVNSATPEERAKFYAFLARANTDPSVAVNIFEREDNVWPVVTGVANGGSYKNSATPIVSGADFVSYTLDAGSPVAFTSGTGLTEYGYYVLTAMDKSGNITEVSFNINRNFETPVNTPTPQPTNTPTPVPTNTPTPAVMPGGVSLPANTPTPTPKVMPGGVTDPENMPTQQLTKAPTQQPTQPTKAPTKQPTQSPAQPTQTVVQATPTPLPRQVFIDAEKTINVTQDSKTSLEAFKQVNQVIFETTDITESEEAKVVEIIKNAMEKVGTIAVTEEVTEEQIEEQIEEVLTNLEEAKQIANNLTNTVVVNNKETVMEQLEEEVFVKIVDTKEEKNVKVPVTAVKKLEDKKVGIAYDNGKISFKLPSKKLKVPENSQKLELSAKLLTKEESKEKIEVIENIVNNPKAMVIELNAKFDDQPAEFEEEKMIPVTVNNPVPEGEDPNTYVVYYLKKVGDTYVKELVRPQTYDPATGSFTFNLKHFSEYLIDSNEVSFNDIDSYTWAKDKIISLASKEIIAGMSDGKFEPALQLTRAQFATLIVKNFGILNDNAEVKFNDVASDAWYYKAVASAFNAGIVSGRPNGNFAPEETVSRADMAVMINNAAKFLNLKAFAKTPNNAQKFADDAEIPQYAKEAVAKATMAGVFSGYPGNLYKPNNKAIRAEAAVVIYKLFVME